MPEFSIELCGDVRIEIDGRRRERDLPGRLGRVLFGYLVLNRRRAVAREELIEALWPQEPPADAPGTLSTLLSRLRRLLGPEHLQGRAALQLVLPEGTYVDVEQADLHVLERVLIPGFDAPWLDQHRRELEQERLTALELLARESLDRRDARGADAAARRLVALAPYRESGYALLMAAQEAQGNAAEALQTFERVRELTRDELGTVPSPELRATHQRLLERAHAPAALPFPAPLERAARRSFVGRAEALDRLHAHLAAGERRFVFLAGEPGIGKTSLAATFARAAHTQGAAVLYGRCDEDALTPYQPFVEMLAQWLPGEELGRLIGRGAPAPDSGPGERYRLFESVAATLARLGGTPVLVCDDLQWADPPTLQLIRHLARAAEPARLLLVGAYRDVEAEAPLRDLIADLRREHVFEDVALRGLDAHEAARLLADLPAETAHRLRELSGGNPLFLRALAEEGADAPGIREVVLRRVARLPEPALELLTLAAVAGQTFRPELLEAMSDADVVGILDRALAAGLLAEEPDALSFAHALTRQTLYGELSDARRVRLHRAVGEALFAHRVRLRPDPAELAHHFFRARHVAGPEPAIRYAREAAERAAAALAWEDEARQLERALEADELRDSPDTADRTDLLLALGEARTRGGQTPAARGAFAAAAALAPAPDQLARAAIGYGGRYYEAGVIDPELIALLRRALATDTGLRPQLLARLAEALHFAGETEESIRLAAEAVELARPLGDDEALAGALAGRHVSLLHVAHVEERMRLGAELLGRATDPRRELQGLQARIFDRLTLGDLAGARADRERLAALAETLREPLYVHFAVGWAGTFAQIDGDLDEAERLALRSYELRRRLATRDAESVLGAQLFMIRRAQGRLAELLPAVTEAVEQWPALAAWRAGLPLVQLAAGDEAAARAELERLVGGLDAIPRDFFWLTAVTLLADAAATLGGPCDALYAALSPFPTRFVQIGYAANDGPVARPLGRLAAAGGDHARALAHLEDALAICTRAGAPAFAARAREDLAYA